MGFKETQSKRMKEKWETDPDFRNRMMKTNPILRGDMTGKKNPMYGKRFCGEDNPMYGKKHTEESLEKMHRPRSLETKRAISDSKLGRVWINNGSISKHILPEYLDKYLSEGWMKGRN